MQPILKFENDIYLGVMSGTSLDGIDVVAVIFEPQLTILASTSYPMASDIKELILTLCSSSDDEIEKLGHLDIVLGDLFAQSCNQLIADNSQIDRTRIKAIGLHGQTIRHQPDNHPKYNFSLQIGDANTVAEETQLLTVADFRRRDIAAGGQGAPLVPAFHQSIFHSASHNRVIVNIGGMANITLLDKDNSKQTVGFDTGPGNVLLDTWIHKHQGLAYDKEGAWAKNGKTNVSLLEKLLSLNYFSQDIPKSTGREQFNLQWIEQCIDEQNLNLSPQDVQSTLLELTVTTIANEINKYDFGQAEVFVCGGGAHNKQLMLRLKESLPDALIVTDTSHLQLDPDWVEATAFAWLAKQTLQGLPGNCVSATGAKGKRILGAIYQA